MVIIYLDSPDKVQYQRFIAIGYFMMSDIDIKSREDAFLSAAAQTVTFAFQPIVNIHTGRCIGFEALLRNIDRLGYKSIPSFFEHAWNKGSGPRKLCDGTVRSQ